MLAVLLRLPANPCKASLQGVNWQLWECCSEGAGASRYRPYRCRHPKLFLKSHCYFLHFFSPLLLCCSKQLLLRSLKATVCFALDLDLQVSLFPIPDNQQWAAISSEKNHSRRMCESTCSGFKPSHENLYRISYLAGKTHRTVLSCHYIGVKWGSFPDSADKFMLLWCKSNHSHLAQPSHGFTLIYSHLHHHFSTTSIITSRKTASFCKGDGGEIST